MPKKRKFMPPGTLSSCYSLSHSEQHVQRTNRLSDLRAQRGACREFDTQHQHQQQWARTSSEHINHPEFGFFVTEN